MTDCSTGSPAAFHSGKPSSSLAAVRPSSVRIRTASSANRQYGPRQGDVVVLDVRPQPEYDAGHIPGAISVPLSDVKSRLREVPRGGEVVAYCRGPYCLFADEAVRILTDEGRTAARLEEGFPEWKAAGLPVEQSVT